MAKLKEYPRLIAYFLKDILRGDFKSCFKKINDTFLYFLDKLLKRDSTIRYMVWKSKQYIKNYELNDSKIKFAILYFYEDAFNEKVYNKFKYSLKNQTYNNYDIYIANDCSIMDKIKNNDYSHICFVEHGDKISEYALNNLAKKIDNDQSIKIIYTDEDVINRLGLRVRPYFKPQYAPLLLLSHNYMNAFLCLKIDDELLKRLKNNSM